MEANDMLNSAMFLSFNVETPPKSLQYTWVKQQGEAFNQCQPDASADSNPASEFLPVCIL